MKSAETLDSERSNLPVSSAQLYAGKDIAEREFVAGPLQSLNQRTFAKRTLDT